MAAFLYSLNRIWPLNAPPQIRPASKYQSEVDLEKLHGHTSQSPSRKNLNVSLSNINQHQVTLGSTTKVKADSQTAALNRTEQGQHGESNQKISDKVIATATTSSNSYKPQPSSLPGVLPKTTLAEDRGNRNISTLNAGSTSQVSCNTRPHNQQPRMWEDSGYESPLLRTQIYATESHSRKEPAATLLSISQDKNNKKQAPQISMTEPSGYRSRKYHSLEKHSASVSTTPVLSQPKPFVRSAAEYLSDQKGHDSTHSFSSESGIADLGPAYTSTPIKSNTEHRHGGFPPYATHQRSSPMVTVFSKVGSIQTGRSSSCGRLERTTGTDEDNSFRQILQESSNDFHGKYSDWIEQIFQLQADKIQRRLQTQFDQKLESVIREKDHEILEMQQKFRDRLGDFETSTEKFQHWIETLADENERIRSTKDAIIAEMEKAAAGRRGNFEIEVETHLNNFQAEFEKHKLDLQQKHAEQLQSIHDKVAAQTAQREDHFLAQIQSLKDQNVFLQQEKEALERQVNSYRKPDTERPGMQYLYTTYLKEREGLMIKINELLDRILIVEKERDDLISVHKAELSKTQAKSEESAVLLSSQMAASQQAAQELIQKYEDENFQLRQALRDQESQYKQSINELKGKYGKRIDGLMITVEKLQDQLIGQN